MYAEEQVECRRVQLLQHFGERFDPAACKGTCDLCKHNERSGTLYEMQVGVGEGWGGVLLQQCMGWLKSCSAQGAGATGAARAPPPASAPATLRKGRQEWKKPISPFIHPLDRHTARAARGAEGGGLAAHPYRWHSGTHISPERCRARRWT